MLKKYSEGLGSSDEHLSNALIAAYINLKDNLGVKEISFIENHLNKCNECKKRLNEMIEEDKEIDELEKIPVRQKRGNYFIWSAVAMLFIAIGIGIFYFLKPANEEMIVKEDKQPIDSQIPEEKTPGEKILEEEKPAEEKIRQFNENDFAVNQVLENFIARNIRGETGIKIISPAIGDTIKLPFKFEWETNVDADEFEIFVVDNTNRTILNIKVEETILILNNELSPGLYYWKIFVESRLEAIGKFYVKP